MPAPIQSTPRAVGGFNAAVNATFDNPTADKSLLIAICQANPSYGGSVTGITAPGFTPLFQVGSGSGGAILYRENAPPTSTVSVTATTNSSPTPNDTAMSVVVHEFPGVGSLWLWNAVASALGARPVSVASAPSGSLSVSMYIPDAFQSLNALPEAGGFTRLERTLTGNGYGDSVWGNAQASITWPDAMTAGGAAAILAVFNALAGDPAPIIQPPELRSGRLKRRRSSSTFDRTPGGMAGMDPSPGALFDSALIFPAAAASGIEARDLSSTGAAVVAFQSRAIAAQALTSAGAAAASFTAQAINAQTFTAPGAAAITWQAASVLPASLSSSGAAAATWQSAAISAASLTSQGAAAVTWQSLAINGQPFNSAGAASASFAAQSIDAKAFASAGVAAVSWVGVDASGGATIEPRTFTAAGAGAASFAAQSVTARTFTAPGVGAAAWAAQSIAGVQWSSAGVGAFTPQSSAILPRTLSAAGVASVAWVGVDGATPTIEARTLTAAGAAAVSWLTDAGLLSPAAGGAARPAPSRPAVRPIRQSAPMFARREDDEPDALLEPAAFAAAPAPTAPTAPLPTIAEVIGQDIQRASAVAQAAQRQALEAQAAAAATARAADALAAEIEAASRQAEQDAQDDEAAMLLLLS